MLTNHHKENEMLHKKVTIFGRSVPLALILLLATATVALAAWLFIARAQLTLTTAAGVNINYDAPGECTVIAGPGTVDSVGDLPEGLECAVSGVDPTTTIHVERHLQNNGSDSVCWGSVPTADETGVLVSANGPEQPGDEVPPGSGSSLNLDIHFDDQLASGATVGPFALDWELGPEYCP